MTKISTVQINGSELKCMLCGYNQFWQADTLLNRKWLAALDLEGFSSGGKAYICNKCGYKHEFFPQKS